MGGAPFGVPRIVWDGKTVPFEIDGVTLEKDGFRITFTKPVAAGADDPAKFDVRHWGYLYQSAYGSLKVGEKVVGAKYGKNVRPPLTPACRPVAAA